MNFTREPIIETIVTPKEGCKLVVRNSKGNGQEEYFVDAVEIVSFGQALFFRSLERPKSFLVPVSDYEVLEVRETRMVLKMSPLEKGIKIGGGKEPLPKHFKEPYLEKEEAEEEVFEERESFQSKAKEELSDIQPVQAEPRLDKKKDRRRHRRRRGKLEELTSGEKEEVSTTSSESQSEIDEVGETLSIAKSPIIAPPSPAPFFASLLPPPPMLISETIARYRDNAQYKKAFFQHSEEDSAEASDQPLELFDLPPEAELQAEGDLSDQKSVFEPQETHSQENSDENS